MILLIDNYDSFAYNIYQYLRELGHQVKVLRNDDDDLMEFAKNRASKIVISPGPGTPTEAGKSLEIIKRFYKKIPILGICLGHQAIAQSFGARIEKGENIVHGKVSKINHNGKGIFRHLISPLRVTRYHSLQINQKTLPDCLEVTALGPENEIMAVRHKNFPIYGVQFHPESYKTEKGLEMIKNFTGEVA
jgi:anthranilate synthase/aminodeoxychorismate synthase-like glutamine amidotransferase